MFITKASTSCIKKSANIDVYLEDVQLAEITVHHNYLLRIFYAFNPEPPSAYAPASRPSGPPLTNILTIHDLSRDQIEVIIYHYKQTRMLKQLYHSPQLRIQYLRDPLAPSSTNSIINNDPDDPDRFHRAIIRLWVALECRRYGLCMGGGGLDRERTRIDYIAARTVFGSETFPVTATDRHDTEETARFIYGFLMRRLLPPTLQGLRRITNEPLTHPPWMPVPPLRVDKEEWFKYFYTRRMSRVLEPSDVLSLYMAHCRGEEFRSGLLKRRGFHDDGVNVFDFNWNKPFRRRWDYDAQYAVSMPHWDPSWPPLNCWDRNYY